MKIRASRGMTRTVRPTENRHSPCRRTSWFALLLSASCAVPLACRSPSVAQESQGSWNQHAVQNPTGTPPSGSGETRRLSAPLPLDSALERGATGEVPAPALPDRAPFPLATSSSAKPHPSAVYVNADPVQGRCSVARCVPLCQDPQTKPNPKHPDWGWENQRSCVMPGSPTASYAGGDAEVAKRNHGYAVAPRVCDVDNTAARRSPRPPALDAKKLKAPSFYTAEGRLLDAYGTQFLPRAVNNANGWYDICAQYAALEALDDIAATGANAVRIGWAFESIDPGGPDEGAPEQKVIGTHPELLAEILQRAIDLQLVPILTFNDSTGQVTPRWAERMASLITAPGYLRVFRRFEPYLLLGIANELNLPLTDFAAAYETAINKIRSKGYKGTLVVTANEWGQGCDALLTFGPLIVATDPLHNVLFDLHMYTYVHYRQAAASNQIAGGEPERISGCLDELAALQLPVLIGEFGETHSSGAVSWQTIVERANANGQGYAPWLWYGDTEYPQLNMSRSWEGPLTDWGRKATADFGKTSTKASIFQ